jgi:hypothetical protein
MFFSVLSGVFVFHIWTPDRWKHSYLHHKQRNKFCPWQPMASTKKTRWDHSVNGQCISARSCVLYCTITMQRLNVIDQCHLSCIYWAKSAMSMWLCDDMPRISAVRRSRRRSARKTTAIRATATAESTSKSEQHAAPRGYHVARENHGQCLKYWSCKAL